MCTIRCTLLGEVVQWWCPNAPFETLHLDLFLDLHLDIPSVVVLVHDGHGHPCHPYDVSISYALSTPFHSGIHGVCSHSGGTCGGDPMHLVRDLHLDQPQTSILDLWSEWYPHLKPSINYLTPERWWRKVWCIIPCTSGLPAGVYLHVYPQMHPFGAAHHVDVEM